MPRGLLPSLQNQILSRNLSTHPKTRTRTMAPIERITLFKIPKEEDVQRVLEQYKVLAKTATKVSFNSPPIYPIHFSPSYP